MNEHFVTKSSLYDRRTFLRTATTATALSALSYSRVLGANDRVGVGVIGYGLIAKTHIAMFRKLPDVQLVALSDCHSTRMTEGVAACGGMATGHQDFRQLLDNKAVDAVIIATPDHWHALMTMLACAAGKDVYVEKPLTLFVREGEWMQTVAARTKRVVQVGTQQRSGEHYKQARDLIRQGHLGQIMSARIDAVRNIGEGFASVPDGPTPPEFDWQMWLGPAPDRPYNARRGLYHFRWYWDTSGGQMTNLGAHQLDIIDWCLGLNTISQVTSIGGRYLLNDDGETPDTQDALFNCGGFTTSFALREVARGERTKYPLIFYGTKGSIGIDRKGYQITGDPDFPPLNLIPGTKEGHPAGGPAATPPITDPPLKIESKEDLTGDAGRQYLAHARNFIDCIKTRSTPISDLESAHRTSIACHLANLSLRLGRSLRWDPKANTIVNDAEAAQMLARPYRAPWDRDLRALNIG